MTPFARALLILVAVIAAIHFWTARLEVRPTIVQFAGVIVTDRWTGRVYSCFANAPCQQLYPSLAE